MTPREEASVLLTDEKLDDLIDLAGGFHGEAYRIRVGVLNLLQPLFTQMQAKLMQVEKYADTMEDALQCATQRYEKAEADRDRVAADRDAMIAEWREEHGLSPIPSSARE